MPEPLNKTAKMQNYISRKNVLETAHCLFLFQSS